VYFGTIHCRWIGWIVRAVEFDEGIVAFQKLFSISKSLELDETELAR